MEKRILSTIDGSQAVTYTYDKLCRTAAGKLNLTTPYQTTYTFLQNPSGGETTLVSSVTEGGKTYNYTYDVRGNITKIKEGTEEKLRYTYDSLDQLIRVDDAYEGKTHTYTYDTGGNLTSSATYAYTTGTPGTAESTTTYGYGDTNWKDKLTAYNGQEISYDAIGNPLTYRDGMTFTWKHGRELASYAKNGTTYTYSYDDDGYRVKKKTGSTETIYYRNGSTLLTQKTGSDRLDFFYDENEQLLGFKDNGTKYYYTKNLQGDITGILDASGTKVVEYTYDAWGKPLTCTGTKASTIGVKNPFRYRGYYYDAETGFYYVSSRYYDPEIGRWINADDAIAGVGGDVRGYNLFSYCMNNPVNMSDHTGHWPQWIKNAASAVVSAVKKAVTVVVNTVKSAVSSASNILKASSNSLPKKGEPGSSQTLPNPDGTPKQKRWYGPDGNPERDRDYNHPGNMPFPHDHEWKNGERGKDHLSPDPSYKMNWEPVIGVGLVFICTVGIIAVAADDVTVVGVADDFLFGPLGAGVGEGLIMIFG